jgi:hypothetical protein
VIPDSDSPRLHRQLRVMCIIALAMVLGPTMALGVFVYLVEFQTLNVNGGAGPPVLSYIAPAYLLLQALLAAIVPGIMTRSALQRIASGKWQAPPQSNAADFATDLAKLLAVRQTTLIVALALLEGAALLGCIAYFIDRQTWLVGVPLAAIALKLMYFPTESRLLFWLQEQQDRLTDLRREAI